MLLTPHATVVADGREAESNTFFPNGIAGRELQKASE